MRVFVERPCDAVSIRIARFAAARDVERSISEGGIEVRPLELPLLHGRQAGILWVLQIGKRENKPWERGGERQQPRQKARAHGFSAKNEDFRSAREK